MEGSATGVVSGVRVAQVRFDGRVDEARAWARAAVRVSSTDKHPLADHVIMARVLFCLTRTAGFGFHSGADGWKQFSVPKTLVILP